MTQDNTLVNNGYADDSVFFSPTTLAFYLGRHYDRTGSNWPSDAKEVAADVFAMYSTTPPAGQQRGASQDGMPCWIPIPTPVLSDAQAAKLLSSRIDQALDAGAAGWGYSRGIDNASTWATSSNPQYAAEGKVLAAWRDSVWAWATTLPAGTSSIDGMPGRPSRPVTNGSNGATA